LSGPDKESVGRPSQDVWNAGVNLCVSDRPVKSADAQSADALQPNSRMVAAASKRNWSWHVLRAEYSCGV